MNGTGLLPLRPRQMMPTLDKASVLAGSVSCTHSASTVSEKRGSNEDTEDNRVSDVPQQGQDCCWQGLGPGVLWMDQEIKKCPEEVVLLFFHQERTSAGKDQSHPQKCTAGTAQVLLCFILPSLLCAGSSNVSDLHFPKTAIFFHSLSTL